MNLESLRPSRVLNTVFGEENGPKVRNILRTTALVVAAVAAAALLVAAAVYLAPIFSALVVSPVLAALQPAVSFVALNAITIMKTSAIVGGIAAVVNLLFCPSRAERLASPRPAALAS